MTGAAIARCRERIATLTSSALAGARGAGDLVALLARVWSEIDAALAETRAPDAPAPACRAGCATCCRINVGTLAVEGAVVAARVREARSAEDASALAARLLAFHDRVRWLEDHERTADGLACPFLDAGAACAIHPFRPLACRSVSSLDPAECRRALSRATRDDDDDDEDGAPALVRMDLLQQALHLEALAAIADALAARGLDARHRDVSGMAGIFLADPGLASAWLGGARVPLA